MTVSEDISGLEKKAQEQAIQSIHDFVTHCKDPTLARTILFTSASKALYPHYAVEELNVPVDEFHEMLTTLREHGFIEVKNEYDSSRYPKVFPDKLVAEYFRSDLSFGSYTVLEKFAEPEVLQRAMESVDDLVSWTYSRGFSFPDLTKLRELGEKAHKALKPIRDMEAEFWYSELGVPKNYKGFQSFVEEKDITKCECYDNKWFVLSAEFDSPKQAFEIGFDNAHGFPKPKKEYKGFWALPPAVEVEITGEIPEIPGPSSKIELRDSARQAYWGSYDITSYSYKKEAEEIMPVLEQRLRSVLD